MTAEMYRGHKFILDDPGEMTERWATSVVGVYYNGPHGRGVYPLSVVGFSKDKTAYNVTGSVYTRDGNTVPISVSVDDLVFDKPIGGLFNIRNSVVFATYTPRRQWRRGYRGQNMEIIRPFQTEESSAKFTINRRTLDARDFIYQFFAPDYPSVEETIYLVRSLDRLACAFNGKFAIGLKLNAAVPQVYYKYLNVGSLLDDNSVALKREATHVYEELSQYLECHKAE
ncbi:MAG: hypothetical protein GWO28_01235 [candidate division Zixibacteria bacterium]|nr:hypothetical protein [candidate division Zixibacteria bacterium]